MCSTWKCRRQDQWFAQQRCLCINTARYDEFYPKQNSKLVKSSECIVFFFFSFFGGGVGGWRSKTCVLLICWRKWLCQLLHAADLLKSNNVFLIKGNFASMVSQTPCCAPHLRGMWLCCILSCWASYWPGLTSGPTTGSHLLLGLWKFESSISLKVRSWHVHVAPPPAPLWVSSVACASQVIPRETWWLPNTILADECRSLWLHFWKVALAVLVDQHWCLGGRASSL